MSRLPVLSAREVIRKLILKKILEQAGISVDEFLQL
jgi:hypothetical protein